MLLSAVNTMYASSSPGKMFAGSAFKEMLKTEGGAIEIAELLPNASTLLEMAQTQFATQAQSIIDVTPSYIREKVVFN